MFKNIMQNILKFTKSIRKHINNLDTIQMYNKKYGLLYVHYSAVFSNLLYWRPINLLFFWVCDPH
jgi:hypothetical protein